ncbi:FK506-binding protein 15 isoform X2 [Octopus bimaculoides]|uniref:FK506-binding protein 15 isoform X2 n=1 Tax=Octopus bimaculoides TaxID=37653 RepID=UPI00071C4668|nr:FK506-binding protein 15 isoform X2 [Octopus bimaculoides]|eukprot:XP_014775717.1 PREDICTED: FK506-binding protein 15-like isoform X2 [Octopus bimaculoides]
MDYEDLYLDRSKLANLFNIDKQSNRGGNESLTYTAPKQPKKESPSAASESTPALTMACAVQAFKYVGNEHKSQGKLGAAILSNDSNKEYRILLYVTKEKQVTNVIITKSFTFTMQPNNYAMFYDAAKQGWSILFESEQIAHKFAREIAIAKSKLCDSALDTVIIQDLVLGEGNSLETGDSAEVKYTGWLLTNKKLGQVFDSNVNTDKQFRFKVGKGKVIKGWDIGVVGMKKGGQRVLVVPSNLAYGESAMGDKVPPNSSLVFQIEVTRVKLSKSDDTSEPSTASDSVMHSPSETGNFDSDGAPTEETVKSRSRSINEQLAQSPKSDKARLISRMARMGQPMLPVAGVSVSLASGDSETEDTLSAPSEANLMRKPDLPQKPSPVSSSLPQSQPKITNDIPLASSVYSQAASHQMAVYQNPLTHQQPPPQLPMATGMYQQVPSNQPLGAFQPNPSQPVHNQLYPQHSYPVPVSSADIHVPVILSESRQHNTEMRLAVSKITEKVDQVLCKLDHSAQNNFLNPVPSLETSVLMQNIQRIVQENERLKKEAMEKASKVESQNLKISELLQQNQKFVEQSNSLLEQRNDSYKDSAERSQAQVLKLEKDKAKITSELSSATSMVSNLQLEVSAIRKQETELRQKLNSTMTDKTATKEQIENLNKQVEENQEQLAEMTNLYKEERQQRKTLTNKINQLNEEISDLKSSCESLEKNVTERKKKALDERRRHEEEIDELKSQFETDLETYRKKLRAQKASAVSSEQTLHIEEELKREYEEKAKRTQQLAEEKHKRALEVLAEEKSGLEQNQKELEDKIANQKVVAAQRENTITKLNEQLEQLLGWKEKYEKLRSQASSMKTKYEERIQELQDEVEQYQDQVNNANTANNVNTDVFTEVKKVMNGVYQSARSELKTEGSYKGSEVLSVLLHIIKSTTLNLVAQQEPPTDNMNEEPDEGSQEMTIDEQQDENDNNVEIPESEEDQDQVQTPENISNKKKSQVALEDTSEEDSYADSNIDNNNMTDNQRKSSTVDNEKMSDGVSNQELIKKSEQDDNEEVDVNSNISTEKHEQSDEEKMIKSDDKTDHIESNKKQDVKIVDGTSGYNDGVAPVITLTTNTSEELSAEDSSSTTSADKRPSNSSLKTTDSMEDIRPQGPPPLFGSDDDDDDYNRDLFD